MITRFERIPSLFVELYDFQFQVWAKEFGRRGRRQAIAFVRPPGALEQRDEHGQPVIPGAWLQATVESGNLVVIRPASEQDEEAIARHCREMRGAVLQ